LISKFAPNPISKSCKLGNHDTGSGGSAGIRSAVLRV
jgi:hypothetical protein